MSDIKKIIIEIGDIEVSLPIESAKVLHKVLGDKLKKAEEPDFRDILKQLLEGRRVGRFNAQDYLERLRHADTRPDAPTYAEKLMWKVAR